MRTRSATRANERARDAERAVGIDALPDELLARVLAHLPSIRDFGRADGVCRAWRARGSPVEQALRQRIAARGGAVPAAGAACTTRRLCWLELLRAARASSGLVSTGWTASAAVDAQGRLLLWGTVKGNDSFLPDIASVLSHRRRWQRRQARALSASPPVSPMCLRSRTPAPCSRSAMESTGGSASGSADYGKACSFGDAVFGNLLLVASIRMLAIAPFLCLTLGAGLKKDETALVPVALEREGGQQRSGRRIQYRTVLPVQQEVTGLKFELKQLFWQKRLWVYLGWPSSTLAIGRGLRRSLPDCFQIKAQSHVFLVEMHEGSGRTVAGYGSLAAYDVSYGTGGMRAKPCAFSRQAVHPTYSYTNLAQVKPGCPVIAASLLFTATAAVAMNLKSENLKLEDHAQFPQCKGTFEGVFQSPAYIIMYGTTFYEYKAAKLFEAARMTLGEVKVESDEIDEINRLKEKWNKKSTTRRTTTLVKPTEALELKEMCLQGPRRRCDLIYDGRTSANVYEVHRCPAGPTARAQLLLMSRYVAPPWQMVRALRARIHQGGDRELPNSWKDKLNNHEVELSRLIPFRHACSAMSTIYRNHAPLPQGFDAPLEVTVPLP